MSLSRCLHCSSLSQVVEGSDEEDDTFHIPDTWFHDMLGNMRERAVEGYGRATWGALRGFLTEVDEGAFKYQGGGALLTLESGRQLKSRFGGKQVAAATPGDVHS